MKKDEPKCAHEVSRKIEWSETQNGQTANTKCPKGTSGKFSWDYFTFS